MERGWLKEPANWVYHFPLQLQEWTKSLRLSELSCSLCWCQSDRQGLLQWFIKLADHLAWKYTSMECVRIFVFYPEQVNRMKSGCPCKFCLSHHLGLFFTVVVRSWHPDCSTKIWTHGVFLTLKIHLHTEVIHYHSDTSKTYLQSH